MFYRIMKIKIHIAILLLLLIVVITFTIDAIRNTMIIASPLHETKQALFEYFDIHEKILNPKINAIATTEKSPLYGVTDYILHVSMDENTSPEKFTITLTHDYNIGATGGMTIRFVLTPVDETRTRLTVYFEDSWTGIWPPFVFWNPGMTIKQRIINSFGKFFHERDKK